MHTNIDHYISELGLAYFLCHYVWQVINVKVIPYSGKISKGLIFENFEKSRAFLKIFFEIDNIG